MFSNKCGYITHCFNANFPLYVFWLMTYYLLFIFILDYRNDVKQKANSINFLSEVKMGHKAADTTHNMSTAFGPGIANRHTVQW